MYGGACIELQVDSISPKGNTHHKGFAACHMPHGHSTMAALYKLLTYVYPVPNINLYLDPFRVRKKKYSFTQNFRKEVNG